MDGSLHHDHQKRDLQVSREGVNNSWRGLKMGKEGGKRGISLRDSIMEVLALICVLYMCILALINIVFRL